MNGSAVADCARLQSDLPARLGAVVLPAQALWPFTSNVIFGVLLLGGALLFAARNERETASWARFPDEPPAATGAAVTTPTPPVSSATSVAPAVVSSGPPKLVAPAKLDRLAEEVDLLARATRDLHSDRPRDALKVLDEYRRKFPHGLLMEERCTARAQALCALGRQHEAQAELDQLAPRSLAAARAKEICDASSNADR